MVISVKEYMIWLTFFCKYSPIDGLQLSRMCLGGGRCGVWIHVIEKLKRLTNDGRSVHSFMQFSGEISLYS